MSKEGFAKAVAFSSVLLASSFVSPAFARPVAAQSVSIPEEVCTPAGREQTNGRSLNGDRALQLINALIRHQISSSQAERLGPCIESDYAAAQSALDAMPPESRDDQTPWIHEFIQAASYGVPARQLRAASQMSASAQN